MTLAHQCWCCDSMLTTKGKCPICDLAARVSPPHVCLKWGIIITDEHGCLPEFEPLPEDYETIVRKNIGT